MQENIMKVGLCGMTPEEIMEVVSDTSFTFQHALRVANSIYKKRMTDIREIPEVPKILKELLASTCFTGISPPSNEERSTDGSVKYIFVNCDGLYYESVFIPDARRNTICVSTQSGCRMGCPFCATGRYGFHGNLSVRDIINQVIGIPEADKINHVVFMGMGEPMDNLENVLKACKILTAEWGVSIAVRNVTVSTVGIEPAVGEFLEKSSCNLTLSLYSALPEERAAIIPSENKFPFREIIDLMKKHDSEKRRRMTIAYVMVKDVNDSGRNLDELKKLISGSRIRVNLIPYHRLPGGTLESSPIDKMLFFKHELVSTGISASIRISRGEDVSAACGLLASGLNKTG